MQDEINNNNNNYNESIETGLTHHSMLKSTKLIKRKANPYYSLAIWALKELREGPSGE